MKTLNEEINKIKHLFSYKKGDVIKEETESNSTKELFSDEFDKLYIPNFCRRVMDMEKTMGWRDLSKFLNTYNKNKLIELKEKNIIEISTLNELNEFIDSLPKRIYGKCPPLTRSNMTRAAVENTNKKILEKLIPNIFKISLQNNTDVVANFDKERVTDDLANKTTIKDGIVHVPFAIDDFPTEDWDLYFEDFNVSNDKFDFSGYLKKEYGAGDVDAEDIWNEYQEAVLHRLMNK